MPSSLTATTILILSLIAIQTLSQSQSEKESYLDSLLKTQISLKTRLADLKYLNQEVTSQKENYDGQPLLQGVVLEEGIKSQRKVLSQMESGIEIPFEQKSWECQTMTQETHQKIDGEIEDSLKEIDNLEKLTDSNGQCPRNNEIQTQIASIKSRVNSMKSQLQNVCEQETESQKCKDKGLFFDGQSCIACKTKNGFNQTSKTCYCPEETSYWNSQKCLKCQLPGSFSEESEDCECPNKYVYDQGQGTCIIAMTPMQKCQVTGLFWNDDKCIPCSSSNGFSTESKNCFCTDENSFWNNEKCILCQDPGQFDDKTFECECPLNRAYDQSTGICNVKKPMVRIPNLSGSQNKWIYGSELNVDSFARATDKLAADFNLVKCPDETPYSNKKGDCMKCDDDQLYDLSMKQCGKCPKGTNYNGDMHQCSVHTCPDAKPFYDGKICLKCDVPAVFNNNSLQCQCQKGYLYNKTSQLCDEDLTGKKNTNPEFINFQNSPEYNSKLENCPTQSPIFDGKDCVDCSLPKYYDFLLNKCMICDNAMVFDISTKKCIKPKPVVKKFNSNIPQGSAISNYAGSIPESDEEVDTCLDKKPFFDGYSCTSCTRPFYFNFTSNKCEACTLEYTFNEVQKGCVKKQVPKQIVYNSNFNGDSGNGSKNGNYYGQPQKYQENQKGLGDSVIQVKTCPHENPFYDDKECLSCNLPHYFNFQSKKCESCPSDQEFNLSERKCLKKKVPVTEFNSYVVTTENFKGKPLFNSALDTCPEEKPYFDQKECIKCNIPKFFDFSTYSCEVCAAQGQFFNKVSKNCEYHSQKFVSDVKNPQIYYNGDFSQVIQSIETTQKSDSTIEICPSETPFYNPSIKKCISCPEDSPLYDIKYDRCIHCRGGSYYSEERHVCISEGVVSPTIQRMFMNTFSWI